MGLLSFLGFVGVFIWQFASQFWAHLCGLSGWLWEVLCSPCTSTGANNRAKGPKASATGGKEGCEDQLGASWSLEVNWGHSFWMFGGSCFAVRTQVWAHLFWRLRGFMRCVVHTKERNLLCSVRRFGHTGAPLEVDVSLYLLTLGLLHPYPPKPVWGLLGIGARVGRVGQVCVLWTLPRCYRYTGVPSLLSEPCVTRGDPWQAAVDACTVEPPTVQRLHRSPLFPKGTLRG